MLVNSLHIPDVKLITPKCFRDDRGEFVELYNREGLARAGIDFDGVQDNYSRSTLTGTIRGLHYQLPPFAQAKMVRVLAGRIFDVAVDLRQSSRTFGEHVSLDLGPEDHKALFVPQGFAHGFCTLEANTIVMYKVDNFYAPDHDRGIIWNDRELGISWPVSPEKAILSDKDRVLPGILQSAEVFT